MDTVHHLLEFHVKEVVWVGDYDVTLVAADGRHLNIYLEADCCSESYFDEDSVATLNGLVGTQLRNIAQVSTDAPESNCRQQYQCVHALLLTTDKGSDTVLWRNDSNGYYDGYARISEMRRQSC